MANDDLEDYKRNVPYDEPGYASCQVCCGKCCGYFWLFACCGACCAPYKTVPAGSHGIITKFGRVRDVVEPGMHYCNPVAEKLVLVDVRAQVKSLGSQEVMTLDQLPVTIEGDVFFRRTDVVKSYFGVQNLDYSIDQLSQNCLRNVFGRYTLQDCLANRSQIAEETLTLASDLARSFGVTISTIQIKDIRLPAHIRTMLASTATAEREGRAMLITAEAQVKAAELMRKAADMLSTDGAMQIRGLEVMERLAASPNAKLVFIPSNFGPQTSRSITNSGDNNSSSNSNNGGGGFMPSINLNTN